MFVKKEEEIPYEGSYWWSDSKEVTDILESVVAKILGETRVSSIEIRGCDFNDGRESRAVMIEVSDSDHKIRIKKSYIF